MLNCCLLKILVTDDIEKKGLDLLRNSGQFEICVNLNLNEQELKSLISPYHAILIRSSTKITADVIKNANNLKIIGRLGVGVDNIDIIAAKSRNIEVVNTPFSTSRSVAEHVIGLIFSLAKKIPQANESLRSGKWKKLLSNGIEIEKKTLGLLGFGNIGSIVADMASKIGMNVLVFDPFVLKNNSEVIKFVSLDFLLRNSDFVSIHVPLTNETRNIINNDAFFTMKDGVFIINAARGGLIDEDSLLKHINSGKVAGAALDVFSREPVDADFPLLKSKNIITTPHIGASTFEAQEKAAVCLSEKILDFFAF